MSTVSLASRAGGGRPRTVVGTVTGNLYLIGQAGTVTVDTRDEAALWAQGFTATLGSAPLSGTGVVDFGAFPGSTFASVSIAAVDAADPNAVLKAFIVPAATAAHSLDEHLIEAQAEQNRADAAYYRTAATNALLAGDTASTGDILGGVGGLISAAGPTAAKYLPMILMAAA